MINFEKFASEGNEFINDLSRKLGHENEKGQVGVLLRAVLHSIRDCISLAQSFHVIAELPMFMKALYVEQWKYSDRPERIRTLAAFTKKVEDEQWVMGERLFDWSEPTLDLVKTVINSLRKYIQPGLFENISSGLPTKLKMLFMESVPA